MNATSRQQLVDLNGETTNFDLTFTAKSTTGSEFDVLVVDQATLDSNPTLDFKRTNGGTISGNIVSDKDTYQNYFLCIKADNPTEINVTINKREIPPNQTHQQQPGQQMHPQRQPNQQMHPQRQPNQQMQQPNQQMQQMQQQNRLLPQQVPQQSDGGMSMRKLLYIAIAVVGGGFILYYFYTRMSTRKSKDAGEAAGEGSAKVTEGLNGIAKELSAQTALSPTDGPLGALPTSLKGPGIGVGAASAFTGGIASRMASLSIPKRT